MLGSLRDRLCIGYCGSCHSARAFIVRPTVGNPLKQPVDAAGVAIPECHVRRAHARLRHQREGAYNTLLRVTVATSQGDRSVAGTLFGSDAPRLVEIFGVGIEAELAGHMLYIVNEDAPGFIGPTTSCSGNTVTTGAFGALAMSIMPVNNSSPTSSGESSPQR